MKNKVLFGPAGSPINYKGAAYKAPKYISEEGLNSYEYQSPYGVRIGQKAATTLKEESEKHDILVSMHAPYYINLCAKEEEKLEKSIGHLISAARAGEWMGAYRLVFHPGAYLNRKPEKAMEISKNTVNRLFEELEAEGIEEFTFAPETLTTSSFDEVQVRSLTLAFEGLIFTLKVLVSASVMLKPPSGIIVTGSIEFM
jgi:deoxyribonuclease-4